jgi:hypothetical protein
MKVKSITRDDIRWWAFLIALIVGVVIWGIRLEASVSALDEKTNSKGIQLRKDFEEDHGLLMEINERTIRMEENQMHILENLGGR